ncbi:zinc-binding dehydrogenase [Deinococcus yavapaiensis]|uniref:zinc-binding dehydrogenase n=1 Tax=Deinococcus yavapaiensis TaxID=309889 RepID=UPI000DA1714E|nr:zinc-binding dehydrogenase [Deinococcus yavapaiensis]
MSRGLPAPGTADRGGKAETWTVGADSRRSRRGGSAAIELAIHLGLQVTTTVSTGNIEFVRKLSASTVIDRKTRRFEGEAHDIDAVLDSLGMENLPRSFQTMKRGGTVVSIADGPDVAPARHRRVDFPLLPVLAAMGAKPPTAARRTGAVSVLVDAGKRPATRTPESTSG